MSVAPCVWNLSSAAVHVVDVVCRASLPSLVSVNGDGRLDVLAVPYAVVSVTCMSRRIHMLAFVKEGVWELCTAVQSVLDVDHGNNPTIPHAVKPDVV